MKTLVKSILEYIKKKRGKVVSLTIVKGTRKIQTTLEPKTRQLIFDAYLEYRNAIL